MNIKKICLVPMLFSALSVCQAAQAENVMGVSAGISSSNLNPSSADAAHYANNALATEITLGNHFQDKTSFELSLTSFGARASGSDPRAVSVRPVAISLMANREVWRQGAFSVLVKGGAAAELSSYHNHTLRPVVGETLAYKLSTSYELTLSVTQYPDFGRTGKITNTVLAGVNRAF